MAISPNNFTIKQIGSWWRVVGPGGKLINGNYRLKQQALAALKIEVDKFFEVKNYGFAKETSLIIEQELKRIEQEEANGKEIKDGNGTNDPQRDEEGHENGQKRTKVYAKKQVKKSKKITKTSDKILAKHNLV